MFARIAVRRVRTVATVIATTVVASLCTVVGTTGPAHADLLPYVPWSSYLPGWTDQYVPSSDNDCVAGTAELPQRHPQGAEPDRRRHGEQLQPQRDLRPGLRADDPALRLHPGHPRLLPGRPVLQPRRRGLRPYYTDAYYGWKNGDRASVPQAWLTAFDAAQDKKVTGSGDLLLGMNAHINRDLPYVMAAVGLVAPDGTSRKPDYDAVEAWLYDATAPMIAEFAARFDPTIDDTADPLGLGNWSLFQMVSAWRENAWRNAEALSRAPTPEARALVSASIEAQANATAQSIKSSMAYVPLLSSTNARDTFCAAHKGDAPPVPYAFGAATAWGYAYCAGGRTTRAGGAPPFPGTTCSCFVGSLHLGTQHPPQPDHERHDDPDEGAVTRAAPTPRR